MIVQGTWKIWLAFGLVLLHTGSDFGGHSASAIGARSEAVRISSIHASGTVGMASPTVVVNYPANQSEWYSGTLSANVVIPGGLIAPGSNLATTVNLSSPAIALTGNTRYPAGPSLPNVSVPSLGKYGPVTSTWRANWLTLGCDFAVSSVTVSSEGRFSATAMSSRGGDGASNLTWTGAGAATVPVVADAGAGPGSTVYAGISNLTYTFSLEVALHGSNVTCLGSVRHGSFTLNLTMGQPFSFLASPSSTTAVFVVTPPLSVQDVRLDPAFPTVGENVLLSADVIGGVPPLSYVWTGLPPGCSGENNATLSCDILTAGSWQTGVAVTDGEGVRALNFSSLSVASEPTSPGPAAGSAPSGGVGSSIVLAASLSAVGITAYWVYRRRART